MLTAKKTRDEPAKLVKQIEISARAKLADRCAALADESDRRELLLALFPDGLTFAPNRTPDGQRQIWRITGDIDLGALVDASGSRSITTRTPANDSANPAKGEAGPRNVVTPKGLEPLFSA